jgi:hypothetical protein
MSIYSSVRKAIYLSPNRLELLHRRRNLSDQQNKRIVCAVQSGKPSWQEFADWRSAGGFRVEKARPSNIALAARGMPYTRPDTERSYAGLDRLPDLLEAEHNWSGCPLARARSIDSVCLNAFSLPPRSAQHGSSRSARRHGIPHLSQPARGSLATPAIPCGPAESSTRSAWVSPGMTNATRQGVIGIKR